MSLFLLLNTNDNILRVGYWTAADLNWLYSVEKINTMEVNGDQTLFGFP